MEKEKKYVPVLVPKDLVPSIRILKENRSEFGIRQENPFLFATKNGLSHCSGWHAVREVCAEAGFDFNVTATKMRHRISSIYTSLDMSVEHTDNEVDGFSLYNMTEEDIFWMLPGKVGPPLS